VLTPEALSFVADLQRRFDGARRRLLSQRAQRQLEIDGGALPDFLPQTKSVRDDEWKVAAAPATLLDRRVEITGPVERKMMINALNSGAKVFMADFEDSNSPTWENVVAGQGNLIDAIDGTIDFSSADGKRYRLNEQTATLFVRPRGWHLEERHALVDDVPVSAALFDFGLYFFHNARRLAQKGIAPYVYLPKLESHLEARLWNDVFRAAQDALEIPRGTIRATVLIETIFAAFEMDEILYELREHSAGLNAGRWDYLFSIIKKFRNRPEFVLPDRAQVTMNVPFMRAYARLLVQTCHRRGAHAIGGMAAFIPSRKDAAVNDAALARVREDKVRESRDGFDGTWVAHPDLVPVAQSVFDERLGRAHNQIDRVRDDVRVSARDLIDATIAGSTITEAGLRTNVSVGVSYLESWLRGVGAAAINNLMEDAATAEISRAQIWQWVRHGAALDDGRRVTRELVRSVADEEVAKVRVAGGRFDEARALFEQVALDDEFVEFLTIPAYDIL
jgi:malate synthase